jgi:2-methylcitrate dehydratase PrpD
VPSEGHGRRVMGSERTLTERLADWSCRLRLDAIPDRVISIAKSQILSQLAAARASLGHELGDKITRAYGSPLQADPTRSAFVLAALTLALDYDDTVYAGHVSHAAVNVPLAYSRALRLDGAAVLTATIAAGECAARVTAAATLGPFRGQTAAHSHLVGAVIARLRGEEADPEQIVRALGVALAMPPWPLMRAFLGSEAKVLTAAVPVRIGLDACDAAAAGLTGARDIIEHPEGFLSTFASVPLPEAARRGLGVRWHTETASLKVHPGSAYVGSCIDCAVAIHERFPRLTPELVREVLVEASIFTVEMDRQSRPYLCGAKSSAVTLNFSVGYNVATALLTGSLTPADLSPARVSDPRRWALAAKVRVEERPDLTARAISATAPIGEALREGGRQTAQWARAVAGKRAPELVRLIDGLGPSAASFEESEKAIGARVVVRFVDGTEAEAARSAAIGAAGPDTRARHFELMRDKFLASGGAEEVADAVAHMEDLDPGAVRRLLSRALAR